MHSSYRSYWRTASELLLCAACTATLAILGCASPGPPRAPSLGLPQPVRDISVTRIGDTVELHFTVPSRSTDKLLLRGGRIAGQFCRQLEHQRCLVLASSKTTVTTTGPHGTHNVVTWTDKLPPDLVQGRPRLLGYRVEFFSPSGRSAGASASAFTATGVPPAPVEGLHAEGSRLGVILGWDASAQAGDVLLRREDLAPARADRHKTSVAKTSTPKPARASAPAIVWLGTAPPTGSSAVRTNRTLDTTAAPGTPYRYNAQRRVILQLDGRSIELRSSLSAPITFDLREIYPPPAPTGLTAVGFFANAPSTATAAPAAFAVDLIWQPIDDTGLLAGLAGYNVYREPLDADGKPTAAPTRLNTTPIPAPSFHDATASPTMQYRYSVTAVDEKGNESPAATVLLEPSTAH